MIVGTSLFVYVSFLRSENQERKLEKAKVSDNSNEERDQKERTNYTVYVFIGKPRIYMWIYPIEKIFR